MNSWGVYNPNGPYVSAHVIGYLAPSQYGGLSYAVIGKPATDVYLIQTESFGQVAIYAPADEDSSLSSTPRYAEGSTSIDSDISYIYDGIDLDGEGIVEIKPRSYWGAGGIISSGMSGTRNLGQLSHIVVHHTAGYGSGDVSYMKAVQDYHQSLGWGDIGYHFAIGKSGVIMQGRSVNYVGAHAKQPMNTIALGVTLLGNFEYTMPTSAQVNSIVRLLSFLCNKYNISASNIIGHRDVPGPAGSTTCPGNRFYNATNSLSAIRNKVQSHQTPSLTQAEKDSQVKTAVHHKLMNSQYANLLPSVIGLTMEQWSPYVNLSFNIRARHGLFYEYSPEINLVTGNYRTTRTKYNTASRLEVETIFDNLLQENLGKSLSGVEFFDLFSILEPVKNSSNTGLGSSIEYDIDLPKRELTLRFITSYSVPLTDGSTVASALVTEVVFSGMGPLYAPVGSTEPVSSVEPIKQDVEVVKTVGKVLALGMVAILLAPVGLHLIGAITATKTVALTVTGAALLLVE